MLLCKLFEYSFLIAILSPQFIVIEFDATIKIGFTSLALIALLAISFTVLFDTIGTTKRAFWWCPEKCAGLKVFGIVNINKANIKHFYVVKHLLRKTTTPTNCSA